MNCWKGVCMYKEDETQLCTYKDDNKKCDMQNNGQCSHKCRHFEYVTCKEHCYRYGVCDET